jgi:lipopolysaccharide export system permease protein
VKILKWYIAKNVLISTLLVFIVVVALSFIVGLLKELHDIGMGDYGFGAAILYVLLQLPHILYQFSPLLILLGGVLGLGILVSSHELVVIRAAGVSVWQIVGSVVRAALVMIVVASLVGELAGPRADYLAERHKSSAISRGQAVVTQSGVWVHEGTNFLHIEQVKGHHHLEGVTRYEFDNAHHLLAAYYVKSLDLENGQWLLHDIVKTTLKNNHTKSIQLSEGTWNLALTPNLLNVGIVEPEAMSLHALFTCSRSLQKNHLQDSRFQLEFWQRAFQPLAILVMILLAIPFVFISPRSINIGRRILFAIIIGFIFYILAALLGQLSIVLQFSPLIAALLPILLFAAIGYILVNSID